MFLFDGRPALSSTRRTRSEKVEISVKNEKSPVFLNYWKSDCGATLGSFEWLVFIFDLFKGKLTFLDDVMWVTLLSL